VPALPRVNTTPCRAIVSRPSSRIEFWNSFAICVANGVVGSCP
jgi:hypothetical protein